MHWLVRSYNKHNADRFHEEHASKQQEAISEDGSFNQSEVIELLALLQGQIEGE